ncbi:hypothetical protein F511_09676 [Dorcoceras hygrometricum]|uniref:CCHC-type domain-containing protein n=1 Tax=Dorcoceras hygrometricum TaxID=472368 RepID=A0A2Z7AN93_9LAMI|nr:hypothetical protein F511_09676 [Dorcoceras hygrometricum]
MCDARPHAMSPIAAPFQAHGRVHHRATNCPSSSMRRPTGCATSAAHRQPACRNHAHSSAPTSQYRATSALNFVGSSRPASGRRTAIVHEIAQPRARSFARTLGPPHTAAAGGFDFKNFSFSICNFKIRYNYGTIVLKDPSHSSDTTVGEPWWIRIPSPGEAAEEQNWAGKRSILFNSTQYEPFIGRLGSYLAGDLRLAPIGITRRPALHGITDSACKNHLVVVSVQYGPFNPYIPIRSTTIGKSRVVKDPIAMHTSWRSNSDIASVTRASMSFRVVRTNQYNQDLGLIHSTNGNHLGSPNEGSSIDHQQLQSNRQRFRPRGKQFKKKADSSSSGSVSSDSGSGAGSGSSGMSCGQCGGRHPTSQCRGVQGSCRNCGQPGHFLRVCPLLRGQSSIHSQQGSAGGSSQRPQFSAPTQRSGFQPREPSRFGAPTRPPFQILQQAQANALTREQAEETPGMMITRTLL